MVRFLINQFQLLAVRNKVVIDHSTLKITSCLVLFSSNEVVLETLSVPELAPSATILPDAEKATERTACKGKKIQ